MAEITNKRGVPERDWGTHMNRRRPSGGWPNVKEPEEAPGKGIRKARQRLDRRIASYESVVRKGGYHKPGSMKVR